MPGEAASPARTIAAISTLDDLPSRLEVSQGVVLFSAVEALDGAFDEAWLSREERERIARLRRPEDRRLRSAAHGLKRLLLSRLLGGASADFQFRSDERGRPHLTAPADVDVNLSHGAGYVAVSVVRGGRIGVDVERGDGIDWGLVSRHLLHPAERALADSLPAEERDRFFLERWCLKEAVAKATGEGVAAAPDILLPERSAGGWLLKRGGLDIKADLSVIEDSIMGAWATSSNIEVGAFAIKARAKISS